MAGSSGQMRKILLPLVLLATISTYSDEPKTVTGWVSDAHCKAAHVGGKNPDCVRKCVKGGADVGHPEWEAQDMVLIVDGTDEVLTIANPDALKGHEAKHVTLSVDRTENRIHVTKVVSADAP